MNDAGNVRENSRNNPDKRPVFDLVRHAKQATGESSSSRNEHLDQGEPSSRRQEGYLAAADHARLDLPPLMRVVERYISENDRKEWEKRSHENLRKLNEHKSELEILKFGGRFQDFVVNLAEHYINKRNLSSDSASVRILYALGYIRDDYIIKPEKDNLTEYLKTVKANFTKSQDDMELWLKQIRKRNTQEWQALGKIVRQASFKDLPTDGQTRQLLDLTDYQQKRWDHSSKEWGEVMQEWGERYYQMTGSPLILPHDSDG